MTSGASNGFRVSTVPGNVRKMIQNIKEIGSNHSEEEIYAMLKECGMDPNETAQKLLLQDTFHEVKRKRDKKKENLNNRETTDSRLRSGPSGRVGRGGQGSIISRYPSAGGGKHSVSASENGRKDSGVGSTLPASAAKVANIKEKTSASSVTLSDSNLMNTPLKGNTDEHTPHISSITSAKDTEVAQSGIMGNMSVALVGKVTNGYGQPQTSSRKSSGGHPSASDPILVRSNESMPPGAMKREIKSEQSHAEPNMNTSAGSKVNAAAHEIRSLSTHARMGSKPRGTGKNHLEFSRPPSSSGHAPSSSRPSSNYGSRAQQAIGPPKGVSKEWKPKTTNSSNVMVSISSAAAQQSSPSEKSDEHDHAMPGSIAASEDAVSKVERKLASLHIKETQHVIIPNHIHVPDDVRTGLSFGSFNAALVSNLSCVNDVAIDKYAENNSMSYQAVEDSAVEQAASNDNVVGLEEEDLTDHPQPSIHVPENISSSSADVPSSSESDINISQETYGVPQQPVMRASPAYNLSVVPTPVLGDIAPFDSSNPQVCDASRVPSFVVQQPVDPVSANYYAQFYHSGEGDGRISPFPTSGVSTMYNGNIATLNAEVSESSQEGGNHVAMSTIGQASIATQAGVMASNMAATQQGVPMFRQHQGMPMPHYPPNFIPYGHYFSPFYVPPAIPQFLGNNAFLQQGQTSNVYPSPPAGAPAPVKYPLSQFKPGSNPGDPTHMGVNASYGPYGTPPPVGYNTASAATAGNSTNNDDLARSQYKENIMYTAGQQSEGSAVWIAAPGREISGLQANSFYNVPPHGQQMTFTPSQAGHSPFASAYHPAQALTAGALHPLLQQSQAMPGGADMVGASPAALYQQPQHATQMNWPNNY